MTNEQVKKAYALLDENKTDEALDYLERLTCGERPAINEDDSQYFYNSFTTKDSLKNDLAEDSDLEITDTNLDPVNVDDLAAEWYEFKLNGLDGLIISPVDANNVKRFIDSVK